MSLVHGRLLIYFDDFFARPPVRFRPVVAFFLPAFLTYALPSFVFQKRDKKKLSDQIIFN